MNLQLKSKGAIVTGASRGIGRSISKKLASEGSNIALVARSEKDLENVKSEILSESNGIKCEYFICDTRFDEQVKKMVTDVFSLFGSVDILVNCAAMPASGTSSIDSFEGEDLMEQIDVKVSGYLRCAKYASKYMKDNGWGRIINIRGLNARISGNIIGSIRNISVSSLTKNLADDLGPYGINTTVVHPGMTYTERSNGMIKDLAKKESITFEEANELLLKNNSIKSVIDSEDIANIVVFLSSPLSKSINGDAIAAGGGTRGSIYY